MKDGAGRREGDDAGQRRRLLGLGLAVLVLLAAGGVATYYSGLLERLGLSGGEVPPPTDGGGSGEPDGGADTTPPAPGDFRAQLRALMDRQPPASGSEFFELGNAAAAGGDPETGLLAYEEAMGQGYGPALRAIGLWYDPVHFGEGRSPFSRANPELAADYYRRARAAGEAAAGDDLAALCRHVEGSGDAQLKDRVCAP